MYMNTINKNETESVSHFDVNKQKIGSTQYVKVQTNDWCNSQMI